MLTDINIKGRARLLMTLIARGEVAIIERLTHYVGARRTEVFIATTGMQPPDVKFIKRTAAPAKPKPPKKPPSIQSTVRSRIREALELMPDNTEFTYEYFIDVSPTKTAVLSGLQDLCRLHQIHVVRKQKPRPGVNLNVYRKGPPPDAGVIVPRYDTSRTPFTDCDLSGWKDVAPWMFAPVNLPKGKTITHRMELK